MSNRREWTKEEIIFIIENYKKLGVKYCAEKLKRSKQSIYIKMNSIDFKEYRICPSCGDNIEYLSKGGYVSAIKNNSKCRRCISKLTGFTDRYATQGQNSGKDNAFYGKKHSQETKDIISDLAINRDWSHHRTDEFRKSQRDKSLIYFNNNEHKSVVEFWRDKYDEETVKQREEEWKSQLPKDKSFGLVSNLPTIG